MIEGFSGSSGTRSLYIKELKNMKSYNGRPESRLFCGIIYYKESTLASENKDSIVELTPVQSLTSQPLPLWIGPA